MAEWLHEISSPTNGAACVVTIGVFDGVHRGHRALLTAARATDLPVVALTFDPHPAAVFSPGRLPELLGTLDERIARLSAAGADRVVVARFDRALAAQTPETFAQEILARRLGAQVVVVGTDFRFGCDRRGDIETLRALGVRLGFSVTVVPPVFVDGIPARSTTVRQMLSGGEADEAARLLGRAYTLSGTVVRGRQLGRTIGYPTANLSWEDGLLVPAAGIYAGYARREDSTVWRTAISIGTNPTVVDGGPSTVEAYLMDGFAGDLYDQRLDLAFVHRLRATVTFESLDALIAQIGRDVAEAADRLPAAPTTLVQFACRVAA
jgi:riboflavin kinase/FMN adenylyltransferase